MKPALPDGSDPDVEAMRRLSQGDDLALNDIMERWTQRLGSYLSRYLGSESDAVDLVQETFIAVYRAKAAYRPKAPFSTWLFGIACNLARQKLRWRSRHPEVALDLQIECGGESGFSSDTTPATEMQADEQSMAVRAAVLSLPTDLREALILSEYEDMAHAESAKILRCSSKAVETRIYRAKQLLRKKLKGILSGSN